MRKLRNLTKRLPFLADESGAPVVEFAIVAPFLMLITVGIIDIGRAVWTSTTLEHVAREGARFASVRGAGHVAEATETGVQTYVQGRATGLNGVNVAVTWLGGDNSSGSSVTVEATFNFNLLLGGFLQIDPINLESSSTMIIL